MANILIIDDSELVRDQLGNLLIENNHRVVSAENGFVGLKLLRTQTYDLIICDVNMPKIDGVTMLETAFEEQIFGDAKIFMLTTETSVELKARGKKVGVIGWITKPYSEATLIKVINKVLDQDSITQ